MPRVEMLHEQKGHPGRSWKLCDQFGNGFQSPRRSPDSDYWEGFIGKFHPPFLLKIPSASQEVMGGLLANRRFQSDKSPRRERRWTSVENIITMRAE